MAPIEHSSELLSKRGLHSFRFYDFLCNYLTLASKNPYDPISNPGGIINFGTAVNRLMQKELEERLRREDVLYFSSEDHQHYFEFNGKPFLRTTLANFFNKYMNATEPINPDELVVMSGTAACLDALSHAIFDPDDIYLTPTPAYAGIFTDFNDRAQAIPIGVELSEESDEDGISFRLTSELLEEKILSLDEEGRKVKGFVLVNPNNPLGDVYSPSLLRELLKVCTKYKLHVIIDEVYILSIFGSVSATSVMSMQNLPDPQRTHVVWSMTKDFGLAGFRLGVIWTKNSAVRTVLQNLAAYSCSASIIQDTAAVILSDYKWLDEVYFPRNRKRLQEKYTFCTEQLKKMGAIVRSSQSGLFIWFNLNNYLKELSEEGEMELFEKLFDAGVYVVPGSKLYCKTPGWFRMVFAVTQSEINKGFEIMNKILKQNMAKNQKSKILFLN